MKSLRIKPSELLKLRKETGLSYWNLVGNPLPKVEGENVLPEVEIVAKYPHEDRVIDTMNKSNAEFMQRLRNNDVRMLYSPTGNPSTHLIESDGNFVYPNIQDVNGLLRDIRRYVPENRKTDYSYDRGDIIEFATPGDARYFGEHYKKYFPGFFEHFGGGKNKFETFSAKLGPLVYDGLRKRGYNSRAAYDNIMRQLAYESTYGTSPIAVKQHNYGGYGYNGKTYSLFKTDLAFIDTYLDTMASRYKDALLAKDTTSYAKALKAAGYYSDSVENYTRNLSGMLSLSRAAAKYWQPLNDITLDLLTEESDATRVLTPIVVPAIKKHDLVTLMPVQKKDELEKPVEQLPTSSLPKLPSPILMYNQMYGTDLPIILHMNSGTDDNTPTGPGIYKTQNGGYVTSTGHPVTALDWDLQGRRRFKDETTGQIGYSFEPMDPVVKTPVDITEIPKGEPGLQTVSPEFDILLGGRQLLTDGIFGGISNMLKRLYKKTGSVVLQKPNSGASFLDAKGIIDSYTARTGRVPSMKSVNDVIYDGMNVKELAIKDAVESYIKKHPGISYDDAYAAAEKELMKNGVSFDDIRNADGITATFETPEYKLFNGAYGRLGSSRSDARSLIHEDNHLARRHANVEPWWKFWAKPKERSSYTVKGMILPDPNDLNLLYMTDLEMSSLGTEVLSTLGKTKYDLTGEQLKKAINKLRFEGAQNASAAYKLIQDYDLVAKWINKHSGAILPIGFGLTGSGMLSLQNSYSHGKDSGIHIKQSHRGRFTRYLKNHPGMTALKAKHSKNASVRRMATFALNARKWNH